MISTLWNNYLSEKKSEDRDALIVHYLFLVKFVVSRIVTHFPAHIKMDDLYASGVGGLIKAVERFDASKQVKFEGYATLLIRGAIIDELRRLDWIPRSIHQKASVLAEAQNELEQKLGREATHAELAAQLGITTGALDELLAIIRPAILLPLNSEYPVFSEQENTPLSERIPDEKAKTGCEIAEENESLAILQQAISHLGDQEKKVLTLYYYEGMLLKEIGKKLKISESRVSQIHTQALLKLRHKLKSSFLGPAIN